MTSLIDALESFIESEEFPQVVLDATLAQSNGGGISVEIFEDGSYRILPNGHIGNLYESPGVVLGVPTLDSEQWNDCDEAEERGDDPLDVIREFYADELAAELRDKLINEEA